MYLYALWYSVPRTLWMKNVEFFIQIRKFAKDESTFYGDAFYDFSKADIGTMDFPLDSISLRRKANLLIFY